MVVMGGGGHKGETQGRNIRGSKFTGGGVRQHGVGSETAITVHIFGAANAISHSNPMSSTTADLHAHPFHTKSLEGQLLLEIQVSPWQGWSLMIIVKGREADSF